MESNAGSDEKNAHILCYLHKLNIEFEGGYVESCEIIHRRFGSADQLEAAVLLQQYFGAAELAVVVVAHGEAVGAGIMDNHNVTHIDLG